MFGQGEDGEAFGDVFPDPLSQLRRGVAIAGDQRGERGFGLGEVVRRPDRFHLSADAFADLDVGRVGNGVPGEVKLAALPCRGAQAAVVFRDDERAPAQPTRGIVSLGVV